MMRIVIDMQGAQAENRTRGIGRYAIAFVHAVVRNRGEHEVVLALNALFPDTIEPIRAAFDGLLPQENIRIWHVPGPVKAGFLCDEGRRHAAELIREAFFSSLRPDFIHITSLFEGYGDDAVTSIGRFDQTTPVSVTLYDLIPFIHRDPYLTNPDVERWYLEKIEYLRKGDLSLAISESSGREATEHLGLEPSLVAPIGTDCDAHFAPLQLTDKQRSYLGSAYGIHGQFVMYTGGIDHRKNIDRLIQAYGALPPKLRNEYQLTVVCSVEQAERERLRYVARDVGLAEDQLLLTGYVSDEDLVLLYNACSLFVFPSWHEGFGLPVLEAMRCGKAVIASNTSSLPEVVGQTNALFDPFDLLSISHKIEQALTDDAFRAELERNSLVQAKKFSWDDSARRAWAAWQAHVRTKDSVPMLPAQRPRLAYVSPLPPARTGIADYSAELIPQLTRWYEVEVIVAQADVRCTNILGNCLVRTVAEFRTNAGSYDRVLYHFGNSSFHSHMFELLEEIPGVVVLHDFFLSGVQSHRELVGSKPYGWVQALQVGHGYQAVRERYAQADTSEVSWRYPANLTVLQRALGVIVHSEFSRTLARQCYGNSAGHDWAVIPLVRAPVRGNGRQHARDELGFACDEVLVCSFGLMGPHKLNHRLVQAWMSSLLAANSKVRLVFVGENDGGEYGEQLLRTIAASGAADRIQITGWVDGETYCRYLAAADVGVQLRTMSRGETSASVLDCMSYGLATIVNAHGSMAEIDPSAVWMLPDEFSDEDLIQALTNLVRAGDRRQAFGTRANEIISRQHQPSRCGGLYAQSVEAFYQRARHGLQGLITRLVQEPKIKKELLGLAGHLARDFPPSPRCNQLLVDISELVQRDAKSGIQRVVRSILSELLQNPPAGYLVEPVYASTERGYRYARKFTQKFLGMSVAPLADEPIDYANGDVFVGLDLQHHTTLAQRPELDLMRNCGVRILFVVYDLLPIQFPEFWPDPGAVSRLHAEWLEVVTNYDGAVCISHAVAQELSTWMQAKQTLRLRSFQIKWFHLGADIENSVPSRGVPEKATSILKQLSLRPTFLSVSTIEPRKAHAQMLAAIEQLWQQGEDVNLVFVGKKGWLVDELCMRLSVHPESGQRLHWLQGISDEFLSYIYEASSCLLVASHGEGFGLSLIEAAAHGLPIIARDIPVFREVAGDCALYFEGTETEPLMRAIRGWLALYRQGHHPKSDGIRRLTWAESSKQLVQCIEDIK